MNHAPPQPCVLFFARGYQAEFFPTLIHPAYNAVFVTLTADERRRVESAGGVVAACFEEQFNQLPVVVPDKGYLATALPADRFLGRFDHRSRSEILGKEISFWRGLLERFRPVAVVNELVAIEISEVLLIEARRAGVRYLAGMNCVVDDYFYWLEDPLTLSGRCLFLPEPTLEQRQIAAAYVEQALGRNYLPFYVKNLAGRRALRPFVAAIAKFIVWVCLIVADRLRRRFRYENYLPEYHKRIEVFVKSLFLKYDDLESIPSDAEVIFYPLHQEPEATLNYMSTFYSNQAATIENILKCMTPKQVLVVKEHPVDKGSLLRGKFRSIRRENSSLFYLPAEISGRQVLARASRVVTLTSTVGWEATVIGKTVYVLGQIFFDHFERVIRIQSFDQLRELLRAAPVVDGGSKSAHIDFVARMVAGCHRGNPFPHDGLYGELNRRRISDAIRAGAGIEQPNDR
jgi:hypothetical protein